MGTTRENSTGKGSYGYLHNGYEIVRMGTGEWYVFLNGVDTGKGARTLKEARQLINSMIPEPAVDFSEADWAWYDEKEKEILANRPAKWSGA